MRPALRRLRAGPGACGGYGGGLAAAAKKEVPAEQLRNTLGAATSHGHRTPLGAILGTGSSLHDQGGRLAGEQRRRLAGLAGLAATIVDEADQRAHLTTNAPQLARLEAPGRVLQLNLESAEEIVGGAVRRVRRRDTARRVTLRSEPGLPLQHCGAVLLAQLLENRMNNALKYGGDAPADVVVRQLGDRRLAAVRDRGPGVAPAWRGRIFAAFQRGEPAAALAQPRSGQSRVPVAAGPAAGAPGCRRPWPNTMNRSVLRVEDNCELRITLRDAFGGLAGAAAHLDAQQGMAVGHAALLRGQWVQGAGQRGARAAAGVQRLVARQWVEAAAPGRRLWPASTGARRRGAPAVAGRWCPRANGHFSTACRRRICATRSWRWSWRQPGFSKRRP